MEDKTKNLPKELFKPLVKKEDTSEKISRPSRTFWQDARRTLFKNKPAMISLITLIFIIIMSIVGPYMNEHGNDDQLLSRAKMPPHAPVLENIPWLGFDGTLKETFTGMTVEEATRKSYARFNNDEEFIDIKVIDEGDGSPNSAKIKATYRI